MVPQAEGTFLGLRVKLLLVYSLKGKGNLVKCLAQGHNKRTYRAATRKVVVVVVGFYFWKNY